MTHEERTRMAILTDAADDARIDRLIDTIDSALQELLNMDEYALGKVTLSIGENGFSSKYSLDQVSEITFSRE